MSGYELITRIKHLEETLHKMGMRWGHDKHGNWGAGIPDDRVAVFPRDEELPMYARDAQLFSGTISQLTVWLNGVQWARDYDMMNKVSDEKKRARKEQDTRNANMVRRLKNQKISEVDT